MVKKLQVLRKKKKKTQKFIDNVYTKSNADFPISILPIAIGKSVMFYPGP